MKIFQITRESIHSNHSTEKSLELWVTDIQPMFLEKSPRCRGWPIHTLSSWRSHLGSVGVDLLHQEPARTVGTHLQPMFLEKSPRYRGWPIYTLSSWRSHLSSVGVDLLHQEPARTVRYPFTAYVSGEVTQVSKMTDIQPKFLEKSPR